MRLIKKIQKTEEITETIDILCNMCGKTLKSHPEDSNYYGVEELVVSGGFGSPKIGDMTQIRFSICEPCLFDKILTQFTIPHEVNSTDIDLGWTPAPEFDEKYKKAAEEIQDYYAKMVEDQGRQ